MITLRAPKRCTIFALRGAPSSWPAANGSTSSPACSGDQPRTIWKKKVRNSRVPCMAAKASETPVSGTENDRILNSDRSMDGWVLLSSYSPKPTRTMTPRTMKPQVEGAAQPLDDAFWMP